MLFKWIMLSKLCWRLQKLTILFTAEACVQTVRDFISFRNGGSTTITHRILWVRLKALTKFLVSINSNSKPNSFTTLKLQFMRKRKRHYLKTDQRQRWMWAFILPHSTQGEIWDALNMRDTFSRLTMIFSQSPQNKNV